METTKETILAKELLIKSEQKSRSKERDLLESCLDEFQYYEVPCFELMIKIKELLAQTGQELDTRTSVEGNNE